MATSKARALAAGPAVSLRTVLVPLTAFCRGTGLVDEQPEGDTLQQLTCIISGCAYGANVGATCRLIVMRMHAIQASDPVMLLLQETHQLAAHANRQLDRGSLTAHATQR